MSVTPEMVAVALGVTAPDAGSTTERQWQMWIDDALMLIESRRLEVDDTLSIDPAKLDYVVRQAVVAHVKRPDEATQVTVSVDDATSSKTYRRGKGEVSITDEWWALLGLIPANGGAFSIDVVSVSGGHAPFCDVMMGGTVCTCGAIIGTTYYRPDELVI